MNPVLEKMFERIHERHGMSRGAVSRHMGLCRTGWTKWRMVPAQYLLELSRLSGMSIFELRQDIFGRDPGPLLALLKDQGFAPGLRMKKD